MPLTLDGTSGATLPTALTVANGGSGMTSATAYAVLCGGTTSTNAHQSVSGVGTSGQVLTSNGASALPSFQISKAHTSLGTITLSGASSNITSLDLTNYKFLLMFMEQAKVSTGQTVFLGNSTSDDVSAGIALTTAAIGAFIFVNLSNSILYSFYGATVFLASTSPLTTSSTAVSFALNGSGTYTGGTVSIYGVA